MIRISSSSSTARFASTLSILAWGLFCCCSWTWCIALYLPVILVDRFGWPGVIAFAVPNVLGAVAFGYVVRDRARSEVMVSHCPRAMAVFSIITVAFHAYFIVFLLTDLVPIAQDQPWIPLAVAVIVLALGMALSFLSNRDWLMLAALVYAVSLLSFFYTGIEGVTTMPSEGRANPTHLAWMTPTLLFGFLLCPYLDLTFHRAIQSSPSRHTFAIFGVAFVIMIGLTIAVWIPSGRILSALALAHILSQCVFTVGAHVREIRVSTTAIPDRVRHTLAIVVPLAALPLLLVVRHFFDDSAAGEHLYLRFLIFYGLMFPGFVVLFRTSAAGGRPIRRTWYAFAAAMIVGLPLYELGFLHDLPWLLVPPVIVLLGCAAFYSVGAKRA